MMKIAFNSGPFYADTVYGRWPVRVLLSLYPGRRRSRNELPSRFGRRHRVTRCRLPPDVLTLAAVSRPTITPPADRTEDSPMQIRMIQFGTKHGHAAGKAVAMQTNPDVEFVGLYEPDVAARE